MGWTSYTLVGVSEDGSGDLVLIDGFLVGTATSPKRDLNSKDSLGSCLRHIIAVFSFEENPADDSEPNMLLELRTSADDVTWTDWTTYVEGAYLCRYVQWRWTFTGDTQYGQRPKLTRFEWCGPPESSERNQGNVISLETTPPAGLAFGDRYLVGVGTDEFLGHDDEIACCLGTVDKDFHFVKPWEGMNIWMEDEHQSYCFDEDGNWVIDDARTLSTGHITILAPSWNSKPAGTWTPQISPLNYLCGFYTNSTAAANLDEIWYKTCLAKGTYTMLFMYDQATNGGIVKIYADSTLLATIDTYAAVPAINNESRTTGLTFTVKKIYDIKVKVDGKNVGSTGYVAMFEYLAFWRTA